MKLVINGIAYNTETSTLIARLKFPADQHRPTTQTGNLYQTRGGAYFVHWEDKWCAKIDGDLATKTGDLFEALSYDQALEWISRDDVEKFGDVLPDPPGDAVKDKLGATIYLRVPQSLKRRIDDAASESQKSTNAWIMRCVESYLNKSKAVG